MLNKDGPAFSCCFGASAQEMKRDHIEPGIWNIFPEIDGDLMWLQGGLMHKHDIREFYLDMLTMIGQTYSLRKR